MSKFFVKVGAACLNQTPLDWLGNRQRILKAIDEAKTQGINILCCPELCVTGYGCEDFFLSKAVCEEAIASLLLVRAHTTGLVAVVGMPLWIDGKAYDSACVLVNGEILGFVGKQNLAKDGVHYEPRWFTEWKPEEITSVVIDGKSYPYGDLAFFFRGVGIGFEICEDAWVEDRPAPRLRDRGVQIIFNPSASHFAFGKLAVRRKLVQEASELGLGYVYTNLIGNEAGRMIYDGGVIISQNGKERVVGPRLFFKSVHVTSAVLEVEEGKTVAGEHIGSICSDFSVATQAQDIPTAPRAAWEFSQNLKEEEFARAVSLALFDYLRKSQAKGYVVSLSGGADSASIACLCRIMCVLAHQELGTKAFGETFLLPRPEEFVSDEDFCRLVMPQLLTCVYQATKNSSETTRRAASGVAAAIDAKFYEIDVEQLVEQYQQLVSTTTGVELSWEKHDLALQNIQARVRGPGVWMIANIKQALLLATSNRSEAAVGYTTMDGDTCGGISPIAGVSKTFIRGWLKWLEWEGPVGIGPIRAVKLVNEQQPTAELRPLGSNQTDEEDLMPYEVLDFIEDLAIGERLSPKDVSARLQEAYPAQSSEVIYRWVSRFYRLWAINQWKRERYAPCFHLDDKNLDPKTWCRFPILSGGFREELEDLRSAMESANNGK